MTITNICPICGGRGQVIRHYERMSCWNVCWCCDGSGQTNKLDEDEKEQFIYRRALNLIAEEQYKGGK